jgi:hypothetical protein
MRPGPWRRRMIFATLCLLRTLLKSGQVAARVGGMSSCPGAFASTTIGGCLGFAHTCYVLQF